MATSDSLVYPDVIIEGELGTGVADLSGSSNQCKPDLALKIGEATVFGDPWPQRVAVGKDLKIDFVAWYSTDANEAADYFTDWYNEDMPAARHFDIYIPTKTVGSAVISGDFLFTGMKIDITAGDTKPIQISMQLLNAGPVTISAYSTGS